MDINTLIDRIEKKNNDRKVESVYKLEDSYLVKLGGILDPWIKADNNGLKLTPLNLSKDMNLIYKANDKTLVYGKSIEMIGVKS